MARPVTAAIGSWLPNDSYRRSAIADRPAARTSAVMTMCSGRNATLLRSGTACAAGKSGRWAGTDVLMC